MENQNDVKVVEGTQDPSEKKPNFVVRAGKAICYGYQRFKRTKVGGVVTTLVKGSALVFTGWELHKHYGKPGVIELHFDHEDEPAEEEPIDQPEETGNDETEVE